jgi:hypothetical protein
MRALEEFKEICESLEGLDESTIAQNKVARPEEATTPIRWRRVVHSGWFLGIWWAVLAATILLFCGQTSKFIYIDF